MNWRKTIFDESRSSPQTELWQFLAGGARERRRVFYSAPNRLPACLPERLASKPPFVLCDVRAHFSNNRQCSELSPRAPESQAPKSRAPRTKSSATEINCARENETTTVLQTGRFRLLRGAQVGRSLHHRSAGHSARRKVGDDFGGTYRR